VGGGLGTAGLGYSGLLFKLSSAGSGWYGGAGIGGGLGTAGVGYSGLLLVRVVRLGCLSSGGGVGGGCGVGGGVGQTQVVVGRVRMSLCSNIVFLILYFKSSNSFSALGLVLMLVAFDSRR
jgi:hypothetical protein